MGQRKCGYTGRWAFIDLTRNTVEVRESDPEVEKAYLGGRGVGAYLVAERLEACGGPIDALGPENRVVIGGAPLHGTRVPTAGRGSASFISPMTRCRQPHSSPLPPVHGLVTHSSMGGAFPNLLKRAGYDQIIIDGRASGPVRVVIDADSIRIESAGPEWFEARHGQLTVPCAGRMDALLKEAGGPSSASVYLGPAGWSRVPWACLTTDGDRNFGRGGAGAVFGSKNLLAVTVSGTQAWEWHDQGRSQEPIRELAAEVRGRVQDPGSTAHFRPTVGTTYWLDRAQRGGYLGKAGGYLPWHNYSEGLVPEPQYEKVSTGAFLEISARHKICAGCREVVCSRLVQVEDGSLLPRPEFETAALFINCGITDRTDIVRLNHHCNETGVDTMTMAAMVSAAMELDEKGVLPRLGLALPFGDAQAALRFISDVAYRNGRAGELFAQETDAIIAAILAQTGPDCLEDLLWCLTTAHGGLGYAGIEPKAFPSMLACYATSSRGRGDHTYAWTVQGEEAGLTGAGAIAEVVATSQWHKALLDSLGLCDFFPGGITSDAFLTLYAALTGNVYTEEQLIACGRSIFHLERAINGIQGRDRAYDAYLPPKLFVPMNCGALRGRRADHVLHQEILDAYYQFQGWTREGRVKELPAVLVPQCLQEG